MTPSELSTLTDAALDRHFSPGRAARLRDLMNIYGLGLDVVSRAHKVLVGLGVNPSNDRDWSFYLCEREPLGLEIHNHTDGTIITIHVLPVE
jgi:hypothetical protein